MNTKIIDSINKGIDELNVENEQAKNVSFVSIFQIM